MSKVLNNDGICLLHDFDSNYSTSRFYSHRIDRYRIGGHPYAHFTENDLLELMKEQFQEVELCLLYNPFYLEGFEGQNNESLKRESYAYIISLFNLSKLLPPSTDYKELFYYDNPQYWLEMEDLFSEFFILEEQEFRKIQDSTAKLPKQTDFIQNIQVPLVIKPHISRLKSGRLSMTLPSSALVAIGTGKR